MNIREAYCVHCGKPFVCRRTTAKFCSNGCKMSYHRHGSLMKQKSQDAELLLKDMFNLVEDSQFWHSRETILMLSKLEVSISAIKANTWNGMAKIKESGE